MNADNNQLLERLADLQELTAKKKFRLAKPEQKESINVLSNLIESNAGNAEKALASLPEFPSDVGAAVLAKMWQHLQTQQLPIFQTLHSANFSSDLCKRLRLTLGCKLLSISPPDAFRVLLETCQDMKLAKKTFPATKNLKLICTALLQKGYSLLHKLPLGDYPRGQVQFLVVCLLAAGFLAKNKGKIICSQDVQLELLRWTRNFTNLSVIPAEVGKGITTAIGDWSSDYKKILATEMDAMHASIRDAVGAAVRVTTPLEEAQPAMTSRVGEDQPKPQYDPLYEIGRLVEHIKQQDRLFKSTMQKLKQTERDSSSARSELNMIRRDREELKRQLAIERKNLDTARKEQEQLVKSRDAVVEELNITKAALKDAQSQHKATLESHDKQLDSLSERIATEGDHRIETFKKKLKSKLRTYGQSLQEAQEMEMTQELGKALLIQLKQIVKILKSEGIDIEGPK